MRVIEKIKIGVIGAVLIFLACVEHNQKEKTYNAKLEAENIKVEYKRFGIKGTTVSGQLPRGGNIFLRSELGMGGWDGAIDPQNNIAYIASGFGLRTFDVSDPNNIKFLGVIGLPHFCRDVDVSGGIAFVACGTAGLRIIDVSNPEYPREITFYDTPDYAWGIYRVGTIVYVADGLSGLRIIDVSNPYNPQFLGWLDTPGEAIDVFVKDNKAYVADRGRGLRIIDVSNPTTPQEIGAFEPAGSKDFWDVYVVGTTAYVADGYPSGLSPALRIIDVSDPANPTQISSITLFTDRTGWWGANWLSYKGNYIFYSHYWAWGGTNPPWGGVRVIDVSNPSSPFICAEIYEPWTETHGVFVNPTTNLLYLVWDWQRFATFDISNPCNPVLLNIWQAPGDSWGVALDPSRNIAYIGDWRGGLRIIDISDISFPKEISYWDTPCYARGMDVKTHPSGATIAYVADACGGLRIIDVTDPQYPQEASFFIPWGVVGIGDSWDVFVKGATLAFFAAAASGLFILDVSDYNNPISVGWIGVNASGVFVDGNTAYVTAWDQGLRIIDVSDLSSPLQIGSVSTSGAWDVFVFQRGSSTIAAVADGGAGLRLIDVTNPASPYIISTFDTQDARDVWVEGNIAYVGDYSGGITLVDISDLAYPRGLSYFITSSDVTELTVKEGIAFAAARFGGLMIFTFQAPVLSLSPDSLNFGPVNQGEFKILPLDIRNEGDVFMTVRNVQVIPEGGAFRIEGMPTLPFSVEPGRSQRVYVKFSPPVTGSFSGNIFISSDGGGGVVSLYGNGVQPSFSVSPTSITFGDVPVGGSSDKVFEIRNEGTGILRVDFIGVLDAGFSLVNPPEVPFYVNPGTRGIVVRFFPQAATEYGGRVLIRTNVGDGVVRLFGNGVAPKLGIAPEILDFGGVKVGEFSDKVFSIRNEGGANMELSNISISGTGFQILDMPSLPMILNPGASVDIVVRFSPVMKGVVSGTVQVSSDGGSGFVSLSGAGLAPVIYVNPLSLDFGGVKIGEFSDKVFSVKNTGDAQMELSNISISGTGFQILNMPSLPMILNPGASVDIVVRFSPLMKGVASGTVQVSSDGGSGFVSLSGAGLAPVIYVNPLSLDFGGVKIGEFSDKVFSVKNTGDAQMELSNISISGTGFQILNMPSLPMILNPGDSVDIVVRFSPVMKGVVSGTVQVSSDGGSGFVSLSGAGLAPVIYVNPLSLDFGGVKVGGVLDKVFSVKNTGDAQMELKNISISGTGFQILNMPSLPMILNPGDSVDIVVRFSPLMKGVASGTVQVSSDGGSGFVSLSGAGLAPVIYVNPLSLDFGGVKVGGVLDKVFSVKNTGDAQMELKNISISGTGFQILNMPSLPMILNPGDSVDIVVRFSPVMKGVASGTVQVSSDGGSGFVSLSGAGLAPVIYVNPLSLDFGGVKIGEFSDKVFSVKNTGDAQMELSNISISGTGFQILNMPSLPMILNPGASVDIVVRFSPVMKGVVSGTVQVSSDGGSGFVSLSGAGLAPVIYVNPLSLDFGGVKIGEFSDKVFSVKNTGDAQMELSNISISGTGFQILNMPSLPMILNSGDSVAMVVRFSPDRAGVFAGNVIVETDGGNGFIRLSGRGQRGVLSLSPLSLNFGQVKLGERKEMSFKIRNEGEEILEVERMEISGLGFEIKEGLRANFSVSAGEEREVKVVFTPQVVGAASGMIMIFTSYGSGQVMLSGEGVSPFLILNPATLNFGDVVKGTEKRMSFLIANGGTYELVVTGIQIVEGGEGFKLVSEVSVPVVIDKGSSREIGVIFSPVRKGVHRGKVLIWTTGGQGQVELHGDGLFPEISHEKKIEFGRVTVKSKKEYAMRITNEGNWPAIITKIEVEGEGFEFIDTRILPVAISIGETKELFIRFSPGSEGEKVGKVKMEGNFGEAEVDMVGVGVKKKGCTIWHTPEDFIPNTFLIFLIISFLKFRMLRKKKRFLFSSQK